jgi:transcriptional regulator with XRE-family HTH domain
MSEGFGARLRRRREAQGIALSTIAGHTKINLSLLEALERDDVSRWPSGIFRRAYIRSYAQAIGLNPDVVAGEFLATYPDPGEEVTTDAIAAALDSARPRAAPPTRLRFIMGSALGSLARLGRAPEGPRRVDPAAAMSHGAPEPGPDLSLAVEASPEPSPAEHQLGSERLVPEPDEAPGLLPAPADIDLPDVSPPTTEEMLIPAGIDVATADEVAEDPPPAAAPSPVDVDLSGLAAVCTELGRAASVEAVRLSLQQAASVLGATGLIVWLWDRWAGGLRPVLAHGYSDAVIAQLPIVMPDADNATAAAFRLARTCAVDGGADTSDALVVPLLTSDGCAGALAIELEPGRAQTPSVRAAATILAALLAPIAGGSSRDESASGSDASGALDRAPASRTMG